MSDTCKKTEIKASLKALGATDEHLDALDAAGLDWLKAWALVQAIVKALLDSGLLNKPTV